MNIREIYFTEHRSNQGSLVALEENKDIPFQVKRVYYIVGTHEGDVRGSHAHKNLERLCICLYGKCTIVCDNGGETLNVDLSTPSNGLWIGKNIWTNIHYHVKDTVLMVLVSELYDEHDYIRNYQEFLRYVGKI